VIERQVSNTHTEKANSNMHYVRIYKL